MGAKGTSLNLERDQSAKKKTVVPMWSGTLTRRESVVGQLRQPVKPGPSINDHLRVLPGLKDGLRLHRPRICLAIPT